MAMKDEYGKDRVSGIRALTRCERTVKDRSVRMNSDIYRGSAIDDRECQKLIFIVKDLYASEYHVYDSNWKSLGVVIGDSWVPENQRRS